MAKKTRIEIPSDIAARVLFLSDRTCCVCRERGKRVQIHHIDEDPSNNDSANLAVLCFDCHHETQIRGGFDRKLDSDQIILYRDDWYRTVARTRAYEEATQSSDAIEHDPDLELVTSLAEIYRENKDYVSLSIHYNVIGNKELRDKYIEMALQQNPTDEEIWFLRSLQNRKDLIPKEVIEREIARFSNDDDYFGKARLYRRLEQHSEALKNYIRGILKGLDEDRYFNAAYYLKELVEEGLVEELFILALKQAADEGNLWWQVRSLQELGWDEELEGFLLEHAEEIEVSEDLELQALLAQAKGDERNLIELRKQIATDESSLP